MAAPSFYAIEAHALEVKIGDKTILKNADFAIKSGEIVAILGPSGSGKTTFLRTVAGLVEPTSGRLKIAGQEVGGMPPVQRSIAMLFQKPALLTKLTVVENAMAARVARRASGDEIARAEAAIGELADIFEMTEYLNRPISSLSGGQEQRAAFIRCLSNAEDRDIILLDEPFKSTLDYSLRWRIMSAVKDWHRAHPSKTIVIVTHDFVEAAYLCDRVGVFCNEKIFMEEPVKLYRSSQNLFVALNLGPLNRIDITENRQLIIMDLVNVARIPKDASVFAFRPASTIVRKAGGSFNVVDCTYLGDYQRLKVKAVSDPNLIFDVDQPASASFSPGEVVGLSIPDEEGAFFDVHGNRLR